MAFLKPDHPWHDLMTAHLGGSDNFSRRRADDFRQPGDLDVHPTMDAALLAAGGHGGFIRRGAWA